MEPFFIQIDSHGRRAAWLTPGDERVEGTPAEAVLAASGRPLHVFVPMADVVLRRVTVPTRNRARLVAAVPYLLEEQLAADVDELHFAAGERGAEGEVAVAIVSRARMDGWLEALHGAGLNIAALIPEGLALPYQPGSWTLWWDKDQAIVRDGPQGAFALDMDNVAFVLKRALGESPTPPETLWLIDAGAGDAAARLAEVGVPLQDHRETRPLLATLREYYNEQTAINLLQGAYSRREQLGKLWRPWRPAAALLLVWVVAQFGIKYYEYHTLDAENARLQQEIGEIYLKTFPEAKRVVNPRVQMEQQLAALRGGGQGAGDFVELMSAFSQPVAATQGLEVWRIGYKDGELNVGLVIGDLQRLEQFEQQLATARLKVEIQSATARDNRVEAQVQIKRGAS